MHHPTHVKTMTTKVTLTLTQFQLQCCTKGHFVRYLFGSQKPTLTVLLDVKKGVADSYIQHFRYYVIVPVRSFPNCK